MKVDDCFPSKYLKSADFEGDQVLTIVSVTQEDFEGDKKPIVCFQETDKELVLNRTNFTTIGHLHGEDTESWIGKQIQLFTTEVDFRGQQVLAIRVRMKVPAPAGVIFASDQDPRPQGNVTDTRKISKDQRKLLFAISMTAFNEDRERAETGIKQLMNFLGVSSTADLNRTDFDRIKNLLESGQMPAEWAGKFHWDGPLAGVDEVPF